MSVKWVVAFAGSRDDYQVAIALEELGLLELLVTDWYTPLDRWWGRWLVRLAPSRLRTALARRYRPALPSRRVRVVIRPDLSRRVARGDITALDAVVGQEAAREADRRNAALFVYSYYANAAFSQAAPTARPKVNFQVHPHPDSMRRLFTEEVQLVPECRDSLLYEVEMRAGDAELEPLRRAATLADLNVVASSYTKQTLIENGIPADRIRVVPYGVDSDRYRPAAPTSGVFRVVFVGQRVQRKGLKYLLEAWRRLDLPHSELVVAGRGRIDVHLASHYADSFTLLSDVSERDLPALYSSGDVFCMPSLAEGFGLVYLEAMACGTPVIGTRNTGAADVVIEGESGFVVDIRDVDALADRLAWCHGHRRELAEMRVHARATAVRFSWPAFREGVRQALADQFPEAQPASGQPD